MAETCAACGFDGGAFDETALIAAIRELGPRWQALLATAGNELRVRPAPGVWSAIEYAAHSRDITALHVWGVEQALTGPEPVIPPVEEGLADAAATAYGNADPSEVCTVLAANADRLAELAANAGSGAWDRGITIGEHRMDVRALLEHALHDSTHHLQDVERGIAQLRGA